MKCRDRRRWAPADRGYGSQPPPFDRNGADRNGSDRNGPSGVDPRAWDEVQAFRDRQRARYEGRLDDRDDRDDRAPRDDRSGGYRAGSRRDDPRRDDPRRDDRYGWQDRTADFFRSPNPHRLYRNAKEGKLAGVCAGIADYVNVDPWIVRIGFLAGLFFFFPVFFFGYIVMWIVLRQRPAHLYDSPEEEVFWRSVSLKPDQTLHGLRAKFRDLDRQIGEMEGYVASREFDLNRQFRDLEKKGT